MILRLGIFGMMVLCFTATSVLADEVLYCTDTAAAGFQWGKNTAASPRQGPFNEERYTIKVVTETERIITRMVGDTAGKSTQYECSQYPDGHIGCRDILGVLPWVFYKNTYARALLAGPPAGGEDPNIYLAYGTCTKF